MKVFLSCPILLDFYTLFAVLNFVRGCLSKPNVFCNSSIPLQFEYFDPFQILKVFLKSLMQILT